MSMGNEEGALQDSDTSCERRDPEGLLRSDEARVNNGKFLT